MSVNAESYVWRHSPYRGAPFVVHLVLADSAGDGVFHVRPEVLAAKARVPLDECVRTLDRFVRDGFLSLLVEAHDEEPPLYRFEMPDVPVVYTPGRAS